MLNVESLVYVSPYGTDHYIGHKPGKGWYTRFVSARGVAGGYTHNSEAEAHAHIDAVIQHHALNRAAGVL